MDQSILDLTQVPHRPDVATDKPKGVQSAEYVAFEKCGPGNVLVVSSVGPDESIGEESDALLSSDFWCFSL